MNLLLLPTDGGALRATTWPESPTPWPMWHDPNAPTWEIGRRRQVPFWVVAFPMQPVEPPHLVTVAESPALDPRPSRIDADRSNLAG